MKAQDIPEASVAVSNVEVAVVEHKVSTLSANAASFDFALAQSWFCDLEPATGNVTLTIDGGPDENNQGKIDIRVQQDGGANRTITWAGGTFEWAGGSAPTLTASADAIDVFTFVSIDSGSIWTGSVIQNVS